MADEPTPDWRLLAPHRPLEPGDGVYVVRPAGGGDAIASWVAGGGSTVLVGGPTGVGKSTELARAAQVAQSMSARWANIRHGRHVGWWVTLRRGNGALLVTTWLPSKRMARRVARWMS